MALIREAGASRIFAIRKGEDSNRGGAKPAQRSRRVGPEGARLQRVRTAKRNPREWANPSLSAKS